jgi:tRNA pseudouridine38/39 synthase
MRDATSRLVGEHDFRNLCKIDATKQITNFHRRILRADINPVSTELVHDNSIHVLDLVGTAFLYHQVRHIMAILFLVGAGLEHPSVMSALVNVDQDHPAVTALDGDPVLEVVDRKPEYEMADALPLTLWDCAYADSDVQWRTDDVQGQSSALTGTALYQQLDSIYARSAIQATLEAHFLAAAAQYHSPPSRLPSQPELAEPIGPKVMSVPLGGGMFRRVAKYIPLLVRKRLDPVDVINRRWIVKKGLRTGKEADAGISNTM